MAKFMISSGHGLKVSGAIGILNEVTEARKVVNKVADYIERLGSTVITYHDNVSTNKRDNVNNIVKVHNSKVRELDVSVHFNAAVKTDKPMGVEVLYVSDAGYAVAKKLSPAIAAASGLKDRGPKKRTDLGFLNGTSKPSVLIEVCFVDSEADAEIYNKKFYRICEAIAETLTGKEFPEPEPVKPVEKPAAKPSTAYQVIAGTYADKANANKQVAELKKKGIDAYVK